MGFSIDGNVSHLKLWKVSPAKINIEEADAITDTGIVDRIKSELDSEDMEEVEIADDYEATRYILILHSEPQNLIVEVTNNFIISDDRCYFSPSGNLWKTLENITKKGLKSVIFPEEPCF